MPVRWLIAVALLLAGFRAAAATPPVEMTPVRLSEHAYYVRGQTGTATEHYGFVSNSGFVVTPDGVVVFDTLGTPALGERLLATIREVTDAPIRRIYISHYHADHMYGTQAFGDTGAEVVAAEGAARYLEGETAARRLAERRVSLHPWVDAQTRIVHPDRYLAGEDRFSLGGVEFRVLNVGSAHSEGDLIMHLPGEDVLFSGDIVFEDRIPFLGTDNSDRWLEVLEQLAQTRVRAIVPGHGAAARDPAQIVRLTRDYLAFVRAAMSEAVSEWIPFDEAYAATDWGDFIELPAFLEANRRNAYSIYLSLEREALRAEQ